jgi:hypothetical protein
MSVKQIHIEKYDIGTFEKEQKPYAMILTDVIQRMPMEHSQAFLLWVYLESLPSTWKPCKNQLIKHFDIGERTYERHMSWLNAVGLIEYRQNRQQDGSFGKGQLVILNGTEFKPGAVSTRSAKIGGTVVNRLTKAQIVHLHRSAKLPLNGDAVERSNDGHINTTKISKKDVHKKINKGQPPVSVFSDTETIKTHIQQIIANRKAFVEDETIDEIVFYIGDDRNYDSVVKKINIALKKVRENKWNIPHGYKGITSQSIREAEEIEQETKKEQYVQEAQAFRQIAEAVTTGKPYISFADRLAAYRESLNANTTGVQENTVQPGIEARG